MGSCSIRSYRNKAVAFFRLLNVSAQWVIAKNQAATIGRGGPPRPPRPAGGGGVPGGGAGAGPYSGWKRYALCFTGSTAIVFALRAIFIVGTVATTVYLSGES